MLRLSKSQVSEAGLSAVETLCAILVVIALGLVSYVLFGNGTPAAKTNTNINTTAGTQSATNPYEVLPPATVPSKTAECSQTPTFQSNGNSGPVTCANGDLNVQEWYTLAGLEPTVLTLGYNATFDQVQSDLCADANTSNSDANTRNSDVVEGTVYQIAALYYGWSFSSNPSVELTNSTC